MGIKMKFDAVYYEPDSLSYPLGKKLKKEYGKLPWISIENHNSIKEMQEKPNAEFGSMKRNLIIGIRKTHKYVENHKVSDYLVPYTSSGCTAMCLYCYLVLENTITENLLYTIPEFAEKGIGRLTFPTKFHMVEPLLPIEHKGKIIFRMSVNPQSVINRIELGTSSLEKRISAVNKMCEAGYPCGLLIAPVILTDNWKEMYTGLLEELEAGLSEKMKRNMFLEIIMMTYSYVHRAINNEAFPNAPDLYDRELMTGRGRGRYCYRTQIREEAEQFLRTQIKRILGDVQIRYIS